MFTRLILALLVSTVAAELSVAENEDKVLPQSELEYLGVHRSAAKASYFLISKDEVDWDKAIKVCEAEGTRLVSIESEAKQVGLSGFLASKDHKSAWTSGNDLRENGDYNWATTNKAIGPYTNWRGGTPPLLADCACVGINARKEANCTDCIGQYKWDEEICATKKKFVCEISI